MSFASKWDVERRDVVAEGHWMWGSDFPHDEATTPFTREHLRISMEGVPTEEKRKLLAANAAALYDFDLAALDREAAKVGPTVEELDTPMTDAEMPEHPNMALRGADGRQAAERAASRVDAAPSVDGAAHRRPAVDRERLAVHVRRGVADEEEDRVRDLPASPARPSGLPAAIASGSMPATSHAATARWTPRARPPRSCSGSRSAPTPPR